MKKELQRSAHRLLTQAVTSKAGGSHIEVRLTIGAAELLNDCQSLLESEVIEEVTNEAGAKEQFLIGGSFVLRLNESLLAEKAGFQLFNDFGAFLEQWRGREPRYQFYIEGLKYSSLGEEKPQKIQSWEQVRNLIEVLKSAADNAERTSTRAQDWILTFFDRKKIKIDCVYDETVFEAMGEVQGYVADLAKDISEDKERRTKKLFFIQAIEVVFGKQEKIALSDFIRCFSEIMLEYKAHHRAYTNSLHPEKIKQEFSERQQDYLQKLNSMLADLNSKVLFLPIAMVLAAGQLKQPNTAATEFIWRNAAIVLGMTLLVALVFMMSRVQLKVIEQLKRLISKSKDSVKADGVQELKEYEDGFGALEQIADKVRCRIWWVIGISFVLGAAVAALFILYHWVYCFPPKG